MARHLFIIGGGEIKDKETLPLDRLAVRLTKKAHPRALFIPTASGEPQGYVDTFNYIYGDVLGCNTDTLYCLRKPVDTGHIREQIARADLIYVGGGNTLRMMRRWRGLGIDRLLHKAWNQGTVMAGLSAGGICWFDYGHSDSRRFSGSQGWDYIRVRGLGFLQGIHCPHFNECGPDGSRRQSFASFMAKYPQMGVALDNEVALEVKGRMFRIHAIKRNRHGYKVFGKHGGVQVEQLPETQRFLPLDLIYG